MLRTTQRIVAAAPAIRGWRLPPAKPRKAWERQFELEDEDGRMVEVDATGWRYALLRYPDGMFELIFWAPGTRDFSETFQQTAAEFILDSELGEAERMQYVLDVEVGETISDELRAKTNPLHFLGEHFRSLTAS
jgi:hypothetical protein